MSRRYQSVAARAGHRCEYCTAPEAIFNFAFEVEHIVPLQKGGADEECNLALACRSCNLLKAVRTEFPDGNTGITVELFHPRQHKWHDHFRIESGAAAIGGITAIGRATTICLRFNTVSQIIARRQWMRLGLFP